MKQEIKRVAALKRKNVDCNIMRFYEAFREQMHCYLVFEELEKTLYQLQMEHKFGKRAIRDIRTITFQILAALVKLKDMGKVHTDLKGKNIMVVNQQRQPLRVKVIDFGAW
ncbi:hypothetical protein AAFF_G00135240 [Aldrovandia affinis]|uniref:Protein kinase domain-containing protein n=1 Tax=Aldrovandia affinis TaxID=143900 RepID=A0AAD7RQF3_9TELE|nr:hypothetical protein AAFF_G00135240 [Aldrovandia affinis]